VKHVYEVKQPNFPTRIGYYSVKVVENPMKYAQDQLENRSGAVLEPFWNRSGTALEPL